MLLVPLVFPEAQFSPAQLIVANVGIHASSAVVTAVSLSLPGAAGVAVVVVETDEVPLVSSKLCAVSIYRLPLAIKHAPKPFVSASGPNIKFTMLVLPLSANDTLELSEAAQSPAWPGIKAL